MIKNNVFYKPVQGRIPTCQELLESMTKEVKSIVYTCKNIVTKQQDKLNFLKVPSVGTKFEENKFEVLKDCMYYFAIPIKERTIPLKINIL
jgi:ATP-dependent protease HslVU (ClpYQ) ATPase subunit